MMMIIIIIEALCLRLAHCLVGFFFDMSAPSQGFYLHERFNHAFCDVATCRTSTAAFLAP